MKAGMKIHWKLGAEGGISSALTMKIPLFFALVVSVFLSACGPTAGPGKGGVALIDLEDAAKRLGRDVAITEELQSAGAVLGDQLAAAQKELQEEFAREKQAVGDKPTAADTEKLTELGRSLNVQFQQKQQQAQQELAAKRLALVNRFREEVKPVAMKIAASRGLEVVLVKSDVVVLANEPGVDITDAVVAELTRSNPAGSATP